RRMPGCWRFNGIRRSFTITAPPPTMDSSRPSSRNSTAGRRGRAPLLRIAGRKEDPLAQFVEREAERGIALGRRFQDAVEAVPVGGLVIRRHREPPAAQRVVVAEIGPGAAQPARLDILWE